MAKISLAPAQWTGVAVLLVVVGMGLEGLRRNAMLKLEARQAAAPAVEVLPCGHPKRTKTALGKPFDGGATAYCTEEPRAHRFRWTEGTWIPSPPEVGEVPVYRDDVRGSGPTLEEAIRANKFLHENSPR